MNEFTMPALGSDMDEGTLNEWLVKPGDLVHRGQVVAVVETTKAAVEVECWRDGKVQEILVPVGETVSVGTPLMRFAEEGSTVPVTPPVSPTSAHRRWVSPAARRLAEARGVDVGVIDGTGPQGAVTISDVERAAAEPVRLDRRPASDGRAAAMRRSIAAAMGRSKREIPHYYLATEVNMDAAMKALTERNAQRSIADRILPAAVLIKAVALAAERVTGFNGFWSDGGFRAADEVHVGVAIALRGGGLVAPAIHQVPAKTVDQVMTDLTDVVSRARSGSLRSSEMSDPTITVTNLGDQGSDQVFGVIYPPQVALVGFGKLAPRVCVVDGAPRIAVTVHASLAADHRVSDGHRGAQFLNTLSDILQQPSTLEER